MSRKSAVCPKAMGLVILTIGSFAWPSVTGKEQSITTRRGREISVVLALDDSSDPNVAGLTGQLNYDPQLFSNPRVALGGGAPGFIAAGQLVEPGKYRFTVYHNPMTILSLEQTIVTFAFHVNATGSGTTPTKMTYSLATAGDATNADLSPVSFGAVEIDIESSAGPWWQRYK